MAYSLSAAHDLAKHLRVKITVTSFGPGSLRHYDITKIGRDGTPFSIRAYV